MSSTALSSVFSRVPATGLFWKKTRARLVVRGSDAKDFLHRMSTQHCSSMGVGEARLNAFTNKQGRLIDVVQQVQVSEDEILLLSTLPSANILREWLETFIFVEDVTFAAVSNPEATWLVAGDAGQTLVAAWLGAAGEVSLGPWEMQRSADGMAVRGFDLEGDKGEPVPCYWLFGDAGHPRNEERFFTGAGLQRADDDTYENLRIAAGVPESPGEVSDRFNPLELQLHDAIHWDKGCYIGQEVIARIDNYGKQSRWIVGVVFEELPQQVPELGAKLRTRNQDGQWQETGALTSVAPAQNLGSPCALAWCKTKDFSPSMHAELVLDGKSLPVRLVQRLAAQLPADPS